MAIVGALVALEFDHKYLYRSPTAKVPYLAHFTCTKQMKTGCWAQQKTEVFPLSSPLSKKEQTQDV